MSATYETCRLNGWAGAIGGAALLARAGSIADCRAALDYARRHRLTVGMRGGGLSFGDAALNTDGLVLDTRGLDRIERWTPETGEISVQAGVTMADILRRTLADGWVVAAVPGALSVTAAGAIANNVHGKDACSRGNFGRHVRAIELLTADGEVRTLSPEGTPELFRAVIGGLGLLGVIVSARLQLVRITSQLLEVETRIGRDMDATVANIEDSTRGEYGQVWVDGFARRQRLGRSITKLARFVGSAEPAEIEEIEESLTTKTHMFGVIPARLVWRTARPLFMPPGMVMTNRIYFYKGLLESSLRGAIKEQLFSKFYFFHNNIPDFYSVYRPPGFVTVQALMPRPDGAEHLARFLELAQGLGAAPVLCGMKRHLADDFLISFEGEGYSISLDLPLRGRDKVRLKATLCRIYEFIAEHGGKVNLSKDQSLPRELFQAMYPHHTDFWQLKNRIDPAGLFLSDIGRRLFA